MKPGEIVYMNKTGTLPFIVNRRRTNLPKGPFRVAFSRRNFLLLVSPPEEETEIRPMVVTKEEVTADEPVVGGRIVVYISAETGRRSIALLPTDVDPNGTFETEYPFVCLRSQLENNQIDFFTEHAIGQNDAL